MKEFFQEINDDEKQRAEINSADKLYSYYEKIASALAIIHFAE